MREASFLEVGIWFNIVFYDTIHVSMNEDFIFFDTSRVRAFGLKYQWKNPHTQAKSS